MKQKYLKPTLVVFAGLILVSFAFFVTAEESTSGNIFLDSDQDGLSNEEEIIYGTDPDNPDTDGDSYSDGVEVEGGYDPLLAAPDDRLADVDTDTASDVASSTDGNDTNLTSEVSQQVADLISTNSTDGEGITLEDLDDIVANITVESSLSFDDLPEIDDADIKIKEQNYDKYSDEERAEKEKSDIVEYAVVIAYIMASNSPEDIDKGSDPEDIAGLMTAKVTDALYGGNYDYFEELENKGDSALEQVKDVEVPENIVDTHKKALKIANYAKELKGVIEQIEDDPLANIDSMSKVQGFLSIAGDFYEEIGEIMEDYSISEIPFEF